MTVMTFWTTVHPAVLAGPVRKGPKVGADVPLLGFLTVGDGPDYTF